MYAREFFDLCQKKFRKGEMKHDYLDGPTDYRRVYTHLLSEVGELIYAMDGDLWRDAIDSIVGTIASRSEREEDRDTASELGDVTNLPVLVYICGKIQGAGEL